MATLTPRQQAWAEAANDSEPPAAALFLLLAQPNADEREHSCSEHTVGFRTREGRRGVRCGICRAIVKWVDPEGGRA